MSVSSSCSTNHNKLYGVSFSPSSNFWHVIEGVATSQSNNNRFNADKMADTSVIDLNVSSKPVLSTPSPDLGCCFLSANPLPDTVCALTHPLDVIMKQPMDKCTMSIRSLAFLKLSESFKRIPQCVLKKVNHNLSYLMKKIRILFSKNLKWLSRSIPYQRTHKSAIGSTNATDWVLCVNCASNNSIATGQQGPNASTNESATDCTISTVAAFEVPTTSWRP